MNAAAALAVTLHVLLTKRDVAAAISWIGIAWLTPFLGSALYLVFGINRVVRRARRLRGRRGEPVPAESAEAPPELGHLASLCAAGERITGRPALPGNRLALLQHGDEAYPRMLAAIGAAEASIALSSYIFRGDALGTRFVEALTAAASRGVQVRVLIDGTGGGYLTAPVFHALRRAGVPAARFLHSWLPWRMPFLNLRTHRKLMIVDGRDAFLGGLNIGAENLAAAPARRRVRDTHFAVSGPVVAQLMHCFAQDWQFTSGERLSGRRWFPTLVPVGESLSRTVTSGPDYELERLELLMLSALATAQRSVRVSTPYFLPNDRLSTALVTAAMRGVAVDVVLPERCDHRVIDWAARAHVAPLLTAGVRIWRGAPPFDHSKLMTIDGRWCLVGSANWDSRSLRLNFELDLEAYDEALAGALERLIAARQERRLSLASLRRRPLPVKLRDAAARLLLPYL